MNFLSDCSSVGRRDYSEDEARAMGGEPVFLNVYDMYWLNNYFSPMGIGIYHTGIEVNGSEFAFGGHPYSFSGVFEIIPKESTELGENFKFRESILLGYTRLSSSSIEEIVDQFGDDFRGETYHLVHKNCNHFSMALSRILCGAEIPTWVNRLASLTACLPFFQRCIPGEWLTPVALANNLREYDAIEEVNSDQQRLV